MNASSILRDPATYDRAAEAPLTHRLHLSGLVLDLVANEIRTSDHQLAGLRKQALDVLLLLGGRAGQVVTKDELMRSVWQDVVVGDGSLAQAISDIRRVLGDTEHRMVRNVARRGYMLVPDLSPAESDPVMDPQSLAAAGGPNDTTADNPVATSGVIAFEPPTGDVHHCPVHRHRGISGGRCVAHV